MPPQSSSVITTTVTGCPTITLSPSPASFPPLIKDVAYSQSFSATGGRSPYTFAINAGSVPTGLSFSLSGDLSGTPTSVGSFSFTITVKDADLCPESQAYTLVINAAVAITVDADPGSLKCLSKGITYSIDPDINAATPVSPIITGNETGTPMKFVLTGQKDSFVSLSFSLPTMLTGATGENIPCAFPSIGVYWEETGVRFNPNSPMTIQLGGTGTSTLYLGITLTIPVSVPDGDFTGTVLCSASYTSP